MGLEVLTSKWESSQTSLAGMKNLFKNLSKSFLKKVKKTREQ